MHPTNNEPVEVHIMLALQPRVVDAVFTAIEGHFLWSSTATRSGVIGVARATAGASSASSSDSSRAAAGTSLLA